MIRWHILPAALLLLSFLMPHAGANEERERQPDPNEKKAAELKWAKGVATDFLDAAFKGDLEQAESLIDASLKEAFAKEGEKRLREWLNNSIAIRGVRAPDFQSAEIAPDQDEASFKGTFHNTEKKFEFSLRVVRHKDGNKWRVCHFQYRERVEKGK